MGFRITWIAFRDLPLADAARALGLVQTGETDETCDFEINGTSTDLNWSVVIFNEQQIELGNADSMKRISTGRDVVLAHVNETVMHQFAMQWVNGNGVWAIAHDSSRGPEDLEVAGNPPAFFEEIRDARFEEQKDDKDVDYISEVPLDVAERITGFRHDVLASEYFGLE